MTLSISPAQRIAGMLLLLASHLGAQAQQCALPPSGQIYWLAADDNYDDRAGFYNGSVGGQVDFVTGKVGSGVRFDNDSDVIAPSVNVEEMRLVRNNFTYEFWARPTAATDPCPESQNGNCSGGPQHRLAIFPDDPNSNTSAGIGVIVATNAICVMAHAPLHLPCLLRHDAAISSTEFTHVAVVMENKQPRLYLNGVLVRTGLTSTRDFVYASWSVIGSGLGLGKYRGDLDEVSLYDRVLSDAEIQGIFNAGMLGKCKRACPTNAANDAWQAASVTTTSGILSSSPNGLFGATNITPEVDSLLFADGQPDGTVHHIEWQTATPIELRGFSTFAIHESVSNFQRGFRQLRLQARQIGGAFATVYDSSISLPYTPGSRELHRCVNLRPTQAQQFRAEFTQQGPAGFSGPRVMELDEFDSARLFRNGFE
jgi:Concanavalin A-like lectin/glucanases superfamily